MSSDPYICELDPDTKSRLKMYLFKNVKNVEVIRNNIVKSAWNCAVIKASLILDPFQVAVAANRAVVSRHLNTMVTKTAFAEILYNLSLTKNISQSLSKFGIERDPNILVCFIVTSDEDCSEEITAQIEGEACAMSELAQFTDAKALKNVYKLNKVDDKCHEDLLDIIVSRMVTKNFVSH